MVGSGDGVVGSAAGGVSTRLLIGSSLLLSVRFAAFRKSWGD